MARTVIMRDDKEKFANQVKELVCGALVNEGLLSEERAAQFASNYVVVFQPRGFFGRLFAKLFGDPDEGYYTIRIMKNVEISDLADYDGERDEKDEEPEEEDEETPFNEAIFN